jgi:hypothetical protein
MTTLIPKFNLKNGGATPTGAVSRDINLKLAESVSVKDFGAVGNGIADDSVAIQNAINSVGSRGTVNFPSGNYKIITGAVIPENAFINLIGDNAVITAGANNISLIKHNGNLQRNGTHLFFGLQFVAEGFTGVTGFESGTLLKALWQNCFFRYCDIGLSVGTCFESNVINCGTWRNRIGIQVFSTALGGGGNGNGFFGNTVQEDDIGYLFYNFGSFPFENNIIIGGVIQGIGYCGVAAFKGDVSVTGIHFEAIGLGVNPTTTVYSSTVPKASIYSENSWASISDLSNGDANGYPQLLLGNARGIVKNISGFGRPANNIFKGDLTSTLDYVGGHTSTGKTSVYLNSWPTALVSNFAFATFLGKPSTVINDTLPNIFVASNPQIPLLDNAVGATINGTVTDAELGFATSASYLASPGSTGSNRITIAAFPTAIVSGSYYIVSILAKASTNTTLTFALDNSLNANVFNLGNQWTRIALAFQSNQNLGGALLYVFPTTSEGATVTFARVQSYGDSSWQKFNNISSQILQGHWNPNKWSQLNYVAAPTTGTWKLGDIVYNTSPASAGFIGWVCTVAGTPGTWRTFGLIS